MNGFALTSFAYLWPLMALLAASYIAVTIKVMGMDIPAPANKNDALESVRKE